MDLSLKIDERKAAVCIVGLGYVGLPLAVGFAEAGLPVTGLEVDEDRAASINEGLSYVLDVKSEDLARAVKENGLRATTEEDVLSQADVIVICVPTPLRKTKDPDISYILESLEKIKRNARPGQLIILESTTYPGTTRELILPALESLGMEVGQDFFLAFSPERVDPGNKTYHLKNTPKVVGGVTEECNRMAAALYRTVADEVVLVSSTDAAEMVKLLENTFRAVNIAMVNEMAIMGQYLGLDTWEIIAAASTKPFGFMPFSPGPGLGGHCIPIDPYYLSWKLRGMNYTARLIELAGDLNSHMPEYVANLVTSALNDRSKSVRGSNILILGAAYKRDVSDVRESPALDIIDIMTTRGAEVAYYDPFIPEIQLEGRKLTSPPELKDDLVEWADCVVVVTDHTVFDWPRIARAARLIVDTRNAMASAGIEDPEKIVKL